MYRVESPDNEKKKEPLKASKKEEKKNKTTNCSSRHGAFPTSLFLHYRDDPTQRPPAGSCPGSRAISYNVSSRDSVPRAGIDG